MHGYADSFQLGGAILDAGELASVGCFNERAEPIEGDRRGEIGVPAMLRRVRE
jgi:hypothetical protein